MLHIDPEEMTNFFNRLRASHLIQEHEQPALLDTTKLEAFFEALRAPLSAVPTKAIEQAEPIEIDATALQGFLSNLKPSIEALRVRGGFCNPWKVASLKRNEVRNTAVLAWLLDPGGDHGLDSLLLDALLARVHEWRAEIPQACSRRARVTPEVNPECERGDRVDIEISGDQFYLLMEVKIDAGEGTEQMSRYIKACESQARNRPWAIIFMTPSGKPPSTAGDHARYVLSLSWRRLADILLRAMKKQQCRERADDFNVRLAELYLRQVSNF